MKVIISSRIAIWMCQIRVCTEEDSLTPCICAVTMRSSAAQFLTKHLQNAISKHTAPSSPLYTRRVTCGKESPTIHFARIYPSHLSSRSSHPPHPSWVGTSTACRPVHGHRSFGFSAPCETSSCPDQGGYPEHMQPHTGDWEATRFGYTRWMGPGCC